MGQRIAFVTPSKLGNSIFCLYLHLSPDCYQCNCYSSSLTSRYDKFMSGSKRNYKEAAKVLEYTRAVERGLQAMEILQAVFPEDTAVREKFTAAAGLQELKRFSVTANGMTCSVVVLNPVGGSNQADIGAILGRSTTADGNTNSNETTKMISDRERKERSTPQRFNRDELVLAIVDEAGFLDTLTGVNVEPQALPLSGIGFSREEITIHPTILSLAIQVISGIKDFIVDNSKQSIAADGVDDSINATNAISLQSLNTTGGNSTNDVGVDVVDLRIVFNNKIAPSISGTAPSRGKYETNENKVDNKSTNRTSKVDSSTGEKHEKVMRKLVDRAISGSSSIKQIDSITKDILTVNSTSTSEIKTVLVKATPNSIRIVGHSVGSSVGALVSLVLDGALNSTKLADFVSFGKKSNKKFKKSSKLSKGQEAVVEVPLPPASSLNINATGVTSMKFPYVGLYKDRIACVCVGPVPCISRSIVPKFVTSIVNGDDFIARLSYESMKELQQRMQDALKAGAGKGGFSSLGYKLGTGFMGDLAKVGGKKEYKVRLFNGCIL